MPRGKFLAKVQVSNPAIQSLFRTGGDVREESKKIQRAVIRRAVARAPKRTGRLSQSHYSGGPIDTGLYGIRASVGNVAPYAGFVSGGTFAPIRSRRPVDKRGRPPGKMGPLPPGPGGSIVWAVEVSGQDPNPWLRKAANDVLLRYGVQVYDSD